MEYRKVTKEQLMTEIETLLFDLRPFEQIIMKKDENGKPGRFIVLANSTTILDCDLTI